MPTDPASASPTPIVAVSATFTAEPVRETLDFWLEQLGLEHRVEFAPYNQVFQQLLDPQSLLARTRSGFDVLLVRFEDWQGSGGVAHLEEVVPQFVSGLQDATANWHVPAILVVCPPSPALRANAEARVALDRLTEVVADALAPVAGVQLLTPAQLERLYPVAQAHDAHADELGHVPYTPEMFAALGTIVARRIAALCRQPRKVVVLDADETLWQGVCAEDGPFGVTLDPERRALQEFMRAQRDAGMLLALCSKNEPEDVQDVFRSNPEMPLGSEDFSAVRINWQSKSDNITSIAEQLGLGLDSVVFIDDNAAECAEVEAGCPEVLTLVLPSRDVAGFLRHVWAFDRTALTPEDRERALLYSQNRERAQLERRSGGLETFLDQLRLDVRIAAMAREELPRVAQLTQRTNQMNLTTVRRSEIDIRDLVRSGAVECLTVQVSDRFGSYGLVGVLICSVRQGALAVDTLLLSCRALGKGVEHRMLARAGELACGRGLDLVELPFVRTARNRPALDFLETLGVPVERRADGSLLFRVPSRQAAELVYRPGAGPRGGGSAPRSGPAPDPAATLPPIVRPVFDDARVAAALRDPRSIVEAVAGAAVPGQLRTASDGAARAGAALARTGLERELVALWGELLAAPQLGIDDSFFDQGGHSLLAVQLIARVRRTYAVELSLELVYSGRFTVAALAQAIEIAQIEQAGEAEYATALAEVESLTDEEARQALQREQRLAAWTRA